MYQYIRKTPDCPSGVLKLNNYIRFIIIQLCKKLEKKDKSGRSYIDLTQKDSLTKSLKVWLTKIGCFQFNSTNSGQFRIGVSQIIAYLYIGYKWFLKGLTINENTHQVHHLDGVVSNSYDPSNLVILTIEDHQLVSKITNECLDARAFVPEVKQEAIRYNSQGHKVRDPIRYLKVIIAKTLIATERWLSKARVGKGKQQSIKEVITWIQDVVMRCQSIKELKDLGSNMIPEDFDFDEALAKLLSNYNDCKVEEPNPFF